MVAVKIQYSKNNNFDNTIRNEIMKMESLGSFVFWTGFGMTVKPFRRIGTRPEKLSLRCSNFHSESHDNDCKMPNKAGTMLLKRKYKHEIQRGTEIVNTAKRTAAYDNISTRKCYPLAVCCRLKRIKGSF